MPRFTLKRKILEATQDAPVAGHPGFLKTYRKVRDIFTWKGIKDDVHACKGMFCMSTK